MLPSVCWNSVLGRVSWNILYGMALQAGMFEVSFVCQGHSVKEADLPDLLVYVMICQKRITRSKVICVFSRGGSI